VYCNTVGGKLVGKDNVVSIRMSEEDKRLLEKDAKEEERNVSNLFLWCWKQWRKTKRKK